MVLKLDITCPSGYLDENGNYVAVDPTISCKPATPPSTISPPPLGDFLLNFATTTTEALGDAIVKMAKHELGAASSLVTYNNLKVGAVGSVIDYTITYSQVSDELGGGLKAEIVTGGVVLKNLFFTAGTSALAIQTQVGTALMAFNPIVGGFAVAVGAGLLVGSLFDVEINGTSINSTFQDMFAGAYDSIFELGDFLSKGIKNPQSSFDDFIVDMVHGLQDMWVTLGHTIGDISDSISNSYHKFIDAVASALQRMDPLVVDLNGNGIALDSWQTSNALFDLNGDGTKENTGWTKANGDDAFLVIDKNGDGKINDISEMFGNADISGFAQLKAYDSNGDGVINSADSQFNLLKLWNDKNANGTVEAGELTTLAQNSITSISTRSYGNSSNINGNLQTASSEVTLANGTTRTINELYFGFDSGAPGISNNRDATLPASFQLNIESILMPYSRGYGSLYSWQAAMTLDATLLAMAKDLMATPASSFDLIHDKFERFLFRWAGVENATAQSVYGAGSSTSYDPRKVAFLEKITGLDFIYAQHGSVHLAQQAWDMFFNDFLTRFMAQGPLHDAFPNASYDFATDKLSFGDTLDGVINDVKAQAAGMDANSYVNYVYYTSEILKLNKSQFTDPAFDSKVDAMTRSIIGTTAIPGFTFDGRLNFGTSEADILFGTAKNDIVHGEGGNDELYGYAGNDYLQGGKGNDYLKGEAGNDIYLFMKGDGQDTVSDYTGIDQIVFGAGDILEKSIYFTIAANDNCIDMVFSYAKIA